MGISIHYMAFPRNGVDSKGAQEMNAVWCANNSAGALTDAKAGHSLAPSSCDGSISEQYELGAKLGISGTPAMVLPDGSMLSGYRPCGAIEKHPGGAGRRDVSRSGITRQQR